MKNSRKILKTTALIVFFILILIILEYFLLTKINTKKESFLKNQGELSFYWQSIENIKNTEKQLALHKKEISEIKSIFLNETSIIDFIQRLEYLAKQSKVSLEMERANIPRGESGEKPIFDLIIIGDFSEVYKFINLLENDIYQVVFEKVLIKESLSDQDKWEASTKIKLLSYIPLKI